MATCIYTGKKGLEVTAQVCYDFRHWLCQTICFALGWWLYWDAVIQWWPSTFANFPLGFAPENGPHQVSNFLWKTQEKTIFRGTWWGPFSGAKQSGKLPSTLLPAKTCSLWVLLWNFSVQTFVGPIPKPFRNPLQEINMKGFEPLSGYVFLEGVPKRHCNGYCVWPWPRHLVRHGILQHDVPSPQLKARSSHVGCSGMFQLGLCEARYTIFSWIKFCHPAYGQSPQQPKSEMFKPPKKASAKERVVFCFLAMPNQHQNYNLGRDIC